MSVLRLDLAVLTCRRIRQPPQDLVPVQPADLAHPTSGLGHKSRASRELSHLQGSRPPLRRPLDSARRPCRQQPQDLALRAQRQSRGLMPLLNQVRDLVLRRQRRALDSVRPRRRLQVSVLLQRRRTPDLVPLSEVLTLTLPLKRARALAPLLSRLRVLTLRQQQVLDSVQLHSHLRDLVLQQQQQQQQVLDSVQLHSQILGSVSILSQAQVSALQQHKIRGLVRLLSHLRGLALQQQQQALGLVRPFSQTLDSAQIPALLLVQPASQRLAHNQEGSAHSARSSKDKGSLVLLRVSPLRLDSLPSRAAATKGLLAISSKEDMDMAVTLKEAHNSNSSDLYKIHNVYFI